MWKSRKSARSSGIVWPGLAALALLWPGRVPAPLDGIPLDRGAEAVALGVILPVLLWLNREFLRRPWARAMVLGLLAWKAAAVLLLTQGGLCAQFLIRQPVAGPIETIQFEDRSGIGRSWDVRANWGASVPICSAIVARPYRSRFDFPIGFVNLLDNANQPQREFDVRVAGFLTVPQAGKLSVLATPEMGLKGRVDDAQLIVGETGQAEIALEPGVHVLHLNATLGSGDARLIPLWNGRDLWSSTLTTTGPPSLLDRTLWKAGAFGTTILALTLVLGWAVSALARVRPSPALLAWTTAASIAMAGFALTDRYERLGPLILVGSAFVPLARRHLRVKSAFLLLGIPWLAFFVTHASPQVGRFAVYTHGDDWLTYQVAAYRIFMHGYWLEGGERAFYYQPLYRWLAGALHVVFGDSSVGEIYWDAACLLVGALLCFQLVKGFAGPRWGLAAAALTLSTFTLSTIWHFVGRGLAEISASGWASLAGFWILRARLGRVSAAVAAGLCGVLVFYTRLNHLPFALGLIALALPLNFPARNAIRVRSMLERLSPTLLIIYVSVLIVGIVCFAARTWFYTGIFSIFHGTSLGLNYTGLAPSTLFSMTVWKKVFESVFTAMIVNESFDPRGLLVFLGVICALLALLQVRFLGRLPLSTSLVCASGLVGTLFAHAHGYPGRFSVHLVPAAVAMSVCVLCLTASRLSGLFDVLPLSVPRLRKAHPIGEVSAEATSRTPGQYR